ncbi:ovostatin-like [Discoglossus pictus]
MYLTKTLLSVTLLCLIKVGRSDPQYILSTPVVLKSGFTEKICVNLKGHEEALDLNVVIQHNGVNTTVFEEDVPASDFFQCNDFTVPIVKTSDPVFVVLSAVGGSVQHLDRKTVVIEPMNPMDFIQMDKPMYKPGNIVQWRIISLTPDLKPINNQYTVAYVKNPSGSRIAQWRDLQSVNGIVSMELPLISDATTGSYMINVERETGYPLSQWFTVEEFVLPRYTVDVQSPRTISVLDLKLSLNVSAIYTYGQPVPGSVAVRSCMMPSYSVAVPSSAIKYKDGFCTNQTGELGSDGSYKGSVDLRTFPMELSGTQSNLNLDIIVTEEGTGNQVRETVYVQTSSQLASINFDYTSLNDHYKRGMPYLTKIILTDEKGNPMAGEEIHVEVDGQETQTVLTNAEGVVEYAIDTSSMVAPNFTVKASYRNSDHYPTAEHTVQRFYSASGSFLEVAPSKEQLSCGGSHTINVRYILTQDGVGKEAVKNTFYYQIMSKSAIVHSGQKEVDLTGSMNGSFSFDFSVSSDLAPSAVCVVYTILAGDVIVDTVRMNVEPSFKNQVSMSFSEAQGTPGSNVDLLFSAAAQSTCAMRVIDKSLTILNPYESFTAQNVYYSIPYLSLYGYNVGSLDLEDPAPPSDDPNKQIFYNRNYYVPVSSWAEGDSYNKLKETGLRFLTNIKIRKSEICGIKRPEVLYKNSGLGFGGGGGSGGPIHTATFEASLRDGGGAGAIATVRKNWADNWVWVSSPTNSEGNGSLSLVVPDAITDWLGSMWCLSENNGFGMVSKPSTFTSFLPIFLELSTPYSIIRGELMELRAFVSNYMEYCTKIRVALENSPDFEAKLQEGELETCVCPGKRASYMWHLDPKKIGEVSITMSAETLLIGNTCDGPNDSSQPPRRDTIIKNFNVEAEGVKKEMTFSNLICVQDTNSETPVSLTLDENVVTDSQNAFVTILGDPMGLPLQNLQNLLERPFGCGESNLARMAPISALLEYLNNTGQLTDEILEKGKRFLTEGYLRQLSYRLPDGSYAQFSGRGALGSSLLTAYTYKTFKDCKPYIYIDDDVQQQSLIWLSNSQKLENGCFKPTGNMFAAQGVEDDDTIFTAFVSLALLGPEDSLASSLLEGAMTCLLNASNYEQSTRAQAMSFAAFTMAQNQNARDNALSKLKAKAISRAGTIHWETGKKVGRSAFSPPLYSSADVETTAYVLLGLANAPQVSNDDLTYMAQIASGLTQQQNSVGGFRSTQDTVVALNALSSYAKMTYTPDAQHNVIVKSGNTALEYGSEDLAQFSLTSENRLLVHRQPLPNLPGEYTIGVSGRGCCLVQATARYNIPVPKENSAFSLAVSSSPESCVNGVATNFNLSIDVSYQGSDEKSNMAIIDIKMLSGYTASYQSLRELVRSELVSKTEEQNGHVILYLNSIPRNITSLSLKVEMGNRVLNVKEATAIVYDYYKSEENGATTYIHPCAARQ